MRNPTVLLAYLYDTGQHVQVGRVREHDDAYKLFERLDHDHQGFYRDARGALRIKPNGGHSHFIDGHAVKFYRLRQQGHEFGNVPSYPLSAVKFTNKEV